MEQEITSLLVELIAKRQFLADMIRRHSKRFPLRERMGTYESVSLTFRYEFHGMGCLFIYDNQHLNFDLLSESGIDRRIDGFHLYDVKKYCESIGRTDLFRLFEESLAELISREELIASNEDSQTYFLKQDYDNPVPFVFDFVWIRSGMCNMGSPVGRRSCVQNSQWPGDGSRWETIRMGSSVGGHRRIPGEALIKMGVTSFVF